MERPLDDVLAEIRNEISGIRAMQAGWLEEISKQLAKIERKSDTSRVSGARLFSGLSRLSVKELRGVALLVMAEMAWRNYSTDWNHLSERLQDVWEADFNEFFWLREGPSKIVPTEAGVTWFVVSRSGVADASGPTLAMPRRPRPPKLTRPDPTLDL